jgi:hypothetical protein
MQSEQEAPVPRPGRRSYLDCDFRVSAGIAESDTTYAVHAEENVPGRPVDPVAFGRGREAVRLVLWTPVWSAWLAGGPVSSLHALS